LTTGLISRSTRKLLAWRTNFPRRKWRALVNKNAKPSVRAQKSNELLPNKVSASVNQTKSAITTRPNELIDIELFDFWVDNLDASTQESFCAFAADNYSVIEIYLYSRFLGYKGTIFACDLWVRDHYEKPDHRKKLLYEIDEMQEDVRKLREDVENGVVKRDAGVARIASMQKEIRGHIDQVEKFTNTKDRKGLLMAGADRAIRELMFIFKDDPIEIPLEEATMSVWARMQLEE
jgi:hypothetical protein